MFKPLASRGKAATGLWLSVMFPLAKNRMLNGD